MQLSVVAKAVAPLCAGVVLTLLATDTVTALEFRAGDLVEVSADERVEGDLYASGDTVIVNGVVTGDLVAAGREIRLNGSVEGDLIAAGQAIVIDGFVGDDVRMAGMALVIGSAGGIGDHVVSAAFSLETEEGSRVGSDLRYSGQQALLAGAIEGSLNGAVSALELRGSVTGDTELVVGGEDGPPPFLLQLIPSPVALPAVPGGLTLTDSAAIGGTLSYRSPTEATIADAATIGGGTDWSEIVRAAEPAETAGETVVEHEPGIGRRIWRWLLSHLRRLAALLLVGVLLVWLAPGWTTGLAQRIGGSPGAALGWGLLAYVGAPLVALMLLFLTILLAVITGMLTLGGLAASIVLVGLAALLVFVVALCVFGLFVAPVVVALAVGRWLTARLGSGTDSKYLPLFAGLVAWGILRMIPGLGLLVALLTLILGLGAVTRWLLRRPDAKPLSQPA